MPYKCCKCCLFRSFYWSIVVCGYWNVRKRRRFLLKTNLNSLYGLNMRQFPLAYNFYDGNSGRNGFYDGNIGWNGFWVLNLTKNAFASKNSAECFLGEEFRWNSYWPKNFTKTPFECKKRMNWFLGGNYHSNHHKNHSSVCVCAWSKWKTGSTNHWSTSISIVNGTHIHTVECILFG